DFGMRTMLADGGRLLSCRESVDFARLRLAARARLRGRWLMLRKSRTAVDFARLRLAARIGLRPIGLLSCGKSVDFARLRLAARAALGSACGLRLARGRRGGLRSVRSSTRASVRPNTGSGAIAARSRRASSRRVEAARMQLS